MVPPLAFPGCRRAIRTYERVRPGGDGVQVEYRCAFMVRKGKRLWGAWASSTQSTVASLLPKLKLTPAEKDSLLTGLSQGTDKVQPAMSYKSRAARSPSAVVFFKKNTFEGRASTRRRASDGKVRMVIRRKHKPRMDSNWHATSEAAFAYIQEKCVSMGLDVPAMSHKLSDKPGVKYVHQVFGLFRDGKH